MALTPEEVKRMEEQADLSDRFNRAADRYRAGNDPRLRAAEREQVLRGREQDVFDAARERRINSNRKIAAADPGRFSAFERNALLGLQHTKAGDIALNDVNERSGLRQHELDMLTRQGENEMGVAREKSYGMVHQGEIAAGISAGVNRELGRAQNGYFDENGNYVPGSSVRAAEATGLWKSELNENNWRNREKLKEMDEKGKNNRKQQDLDFKTKELNEKSVQKGYDRDANKGAAEERASRIKEHQAQKDALREQKDFEKFLTDVENLNINMTAEERKAFRAMSPDEQKAFWKKKVGREDQRQNGDPKNGDRKQFKQGWGTWKDGKWVLDAQ